MDAGTVDAATDVLTAMIVKATERAYLERATAVGDRHFHPLQAHEAAEIASMVAGSVSLCMFAALCEATGLDLLETLKRAHELF